MTASHRIKRRLFSLFFVLLRKRWSSGQALVEAALLLPVGLAMLLVGIESMNLVAANADQVRRTGIVADWIVSHPGLDWSDVAAFELPDCGVTVEDGPEDVTVVGAVCAFTGRVIPSFRVPMRTTASAAVLVAPGPSPEPSPSPSEEASE